MSDRGIDAGEAGGWEPPGKRSRSDAPDFIVWTAARLIMFGTSIADTIGKTVCIVVTVSVTSIGVRVVADSDSGGEHPLSRSATMARRRSCCCW